MSKLYGSLQGNRGMATRCGSNIIKTSAQSYDGSIITILRYLEGNSGKRDKLEVELRYSDYSSMDGTKTLFVGSMDELLKRLS